MKNLIYILLMLTVAPAFGGEKCSEAATQETKEITTDVPEQLKGAMIHVYTTNGETFRFEAEQFKVVPRARQVVVTKQTVSCKADRYEAKPNRVAVLGGQGPTGQLRTKRTGSDAEVESHHGLVLGAQYSRQVNDTVSIGIQVQDNGTALSILGFDF